MRNAKRQPALRSLVVATLALGACGKAPSAGDSGTSSLTDHGFAGKKYYYGFAEELSGFMGNETKFDVLHTHDIFTSRYGGDYVSEKQVDVPVNGALIKQTWKKIGSQMGKDDMYVQYSSGHGFPKGLGVGVNYDEIRDFALGLPAKEVIIFTMACYSGNLVESFARKKDEWAGWEAQGRTLLVMASSGANQLSSTGPGRDSDEAGGPNGSAGSAFGHALWKALIGQADGFVDGFKDGYLSLEEITEFTKARTNQLGGHQPVLIGTWEPQLIMNRVPDKRQRLALGEQD